MNVGVLDVETSKKPTLHPWMTGSYLSTIGLFVALDAAGVYYKEWVYNHNPEVSASGVETFTPPTNAEKRQILFELQDELDKVEILVGHNLKFDMNWVKSKNIILDHVLPWCTQLTEFMLCGQDKSEYGPGPQQDLSNTCRRYGLPTKTDVVKTYWDAGIDTADIPLRILLPYQKNDIMITAELFKKQYVRLKSLLKLKTLVDIRSKALHIMSDLELNGMPFDAARAQDHVDYFSRDLEKTDAELKSYFGRDDINIDSGPELSACLYGGTLKRTRHVPFVYTRNCTVKEPYQFTYKSGKYKGRTVTKYKNRTLLELTCKKRKHDYEIEIPGVGFNPPTGSDTSVVGVYQTNKDVLKNLKPGTSGSTSAGLKKRVLELLRHRSKISKFTSTFAGAKKNTGLLDHISRNADRRAHPNYNQTSTATLRLSSSNPNGQNFPRSKEDEDGFTNPLKSTFIPSRPGGLVFVGDASQLEWRIAAWLAQDQVAMDEIRAGIDCHLDNAVRFFGDAKYRQSAKIMTFRLLYGGSAYAFWIDPKMPPFSKKRWNEIVMGYQRKYQGITNWQERNIREVTKNKGYLYSPTGHIYRIPMSPHKKFPDTMVYTETCIKNYPVQGTATGDIIPLAMNMLQERIDQDPMSFISSNWMGQVHDSVIFDTMPHEVKRLAFTTIDVFEHLPERISELWNVDFNLPMTGECEWGPDYGNMTHSVKHEEGKGWTLKQKK